MVDKEQGLGRMKLSIRAGLMINDLIQLTADMYDESLSCAQSFDHGQAEVLNRYADKLTEIIKDNEGDKDE